MWRTSDSLALLCSHAINPTIAWCKSQVLENTLSNHIISAVLLHRAGSAKRKCTLRSFSVDTRSYSVYYSSDFELLVPYWQRLFPGWQLDHDLRTQTELKGVLEFLKGRGKWMAWVWEISVRQRQTDRETGGSFTVRHHFKSKSILLRAFKLYKDQAQDCNLTFLRHCASTGTENDKHLPPLSLFAWISFFLFLLSLLQKKPRQSLLIFLLVVQINYTMRSIRKVKSANLQMVFNLMHWHQTLHFPPLFPSTYLVVDSIAIFL